MTISTVTAGTAVAPSWGNSVATAINGHEAAWASYSPTPTNFTVGAGTITGRYLAMGKTIHYRGEVLFGVGSAVTGNYYVSLPVSATTTIPASGTLSMLDSGTSYYLGQVLIVSSTSLELHYIGTTTGGRVNSTNPFTWVPTDMFRWSITYEAA